MRAVAVKMMHCCFDRTGRRIRSTEREREVKIGGEYYITESREGRKKGYGDGVVTSQHTLLSLESRNRRVTCLGVPLPALKDTIAE